MKPRLAAALVVLGVLHFGLSVAACAHKPDPMVAAGQSLHISADMFVATARMMDSALDAGVLAPGQYRVWADFGLKFQRAYPLAVEAWNIARRTSDIAAQKSAQATIEALVLELSRFYVQASLAVQQMLGADGGVP